MSILIRGMEMPKERESFTLTIKFNGLVVDTETGIQVAEAQEVPPHGRLIDADALKFRLKTETGYAGSQQITTDFLCVLKGDIVNTPTIIPAEEE